MTARRDPRPGAYRPYVAARRPGGQPAQRPAFRVVVHRRYVDLWRELSARVGLANAQQFWDHVAFTPGAFPRVGASCVLKGKAGAPQAPGYSRTVHYEITGAGRIDYQYNPETTEGAQGDRHGVVRILTIDLGSH